MKEGRNQVWKEGNKEGREEGKDIMKVPQKIK